MRPRGRSDPRPQAPRRWHTCRHRLLLECGATYRMLAGKSPVAAVDEARLLRPAHARRQQPARDERRNPHAPFPWRVLAASQRHVRACSIRPLCLPAVVLNAAATAGQFVRTRRQSSTNAFCEMGHRPVAFCEVTPFVKSNTAQSVGSALIQSSTGQPLICFNREE